MEWKDLYPQNKKPAYDDLLDYFLPDIRGLFLSFDREMQDRFKVHNRYHRYKNNEGWIYGYGRSYGHELLAVSVRKDGFGVPGIMVNDDASLKKILAAAEKKYNAGFEERYTAVCEKKKKNQIERSKIRTAREKVQMEKLAEGADPQKFNKFSWCKKVRRNTLYNLYKSEAEGLLDEALLDEAGMTFYTRCKQAKETRACMSRGQIICHNCKAVLSIGRVSPTGSVSKTPAGNPVINCACGYSYTYREYRRSCNAANMPGGRAKPVFENFLQKWPECRTAGKKMMLIDSLIHECHVTLMSGVKGRSVCVNLIEGTLKQISELIQKLADGKEA